MSPNRTSHSAISQKRFHAAFVFLLACVLTVAANAQPDSLAYLAANADTITSYYPNGNVESVVAYYNGTREGHAVFFYENGNKRLEVDYVSGRIEGGVMEYDEEGKLKLFYNIEQGRRQGPTDFYENGSYAYSVEFERGRLVPEPEEEEEEEYFEEPEEEEAPMALNDPMKQTRKPSEYDYPEPQVVEEAAYDPAIYQSADVPPEPKRGWNHLYNRIIYPTMAQEHEVQGVVEIKALIDYNGDVTETEILKGIGYGCEEAAEIAIQYTRFMPGTVDGTPVNVELTIPVKFSLPEAKTGRP